jgi:hypothetical protein
VSAELRTPISRWLLDVLAAEPPAPEITAFFVGVVETDDGFSACLFGSTSFDEDDDDWVPDPPYKPASRNLPIPESLFRFVGWEDCLINLLSAVSVALDSAPLEGSAIARAATVAVGI